MPSLREPPLRSRPEPLLVAVRPPLYPRTWVGVSVDSPRRVTWVGVSVGESTLWLTSVSSVRPRLARLAQAGSRDSV